MLGISQQRLAEILGVTFQQVQKYEKGTSGIAAARLHRIARAMQVPVSSFFPGTGEAATGQFEEAQRIALECLSSSECVELNLAVAQIRDPVVRCRIIELVRSIAQGLEGENGSAPGP
jgi:transcriptional regulator with XRE-family HTH domain